MRYTLVGNRTTGKAGNRKWMGKGMRRLGAHRDLVTNIARDDSGLMVILFTTKEHKEKLT